MVEDAGPILKMLYLSDFNIDESMIQIVGSKAELDEAVKQITESKRVSHANQVGIDIETVPSILKFEECQPSLLQIATPSKIFIFDLLSPEQDFGKQAFEAFAKSICDNTGLLKVGLGLSNDLKILKKKYNTDSKIVGLLLAGNSKLHIA